MSTHPVVFITTICEISGKYVPGVAPIATCVDTSYDPPYVSFSTACKQHSIINGATNNGQTNTYLNIIETGVFIVNIPPNDLLSKLDILAYPYERKNYRNKINEAELTEAEPSILSRRSIYPPIIQECLAHIECEVMDVHQPQGSDHFTITGKVLGISYDKNLGSNLDEIKENLAQRTFHHFGSTSDQTERYIGLIKVVKRKNSLIFHLEKDEKTHLTSNGSK